MNKVGLQLMPRARLSPASLGKQSGTVQPGDFFRPGEPPPSDPWKQGMGLAVGTAGAVAGANCLAFGGALAGTCVTHGVEPVLQMLSHPATISALNLPAAGPVAMCAMLAAGVVGLQGGFRLGSKLGHALGAAASAVAGIPGYVLSWLEGRKPQANPPLPTPPPQGRSLAAEGLGLFGLASGSLGGLGLGLSAASHAHQVSALLAGTVAGPAGPALALSAGVGALAFGAIGAVGGWELGKKLARL